MPSRNTKRSNSRKRSVSTFNHEEFKKIKEKITDIRDKYYNLKSNAKLIVQQRDEEIKKYEKLNVSNRQKKIHELKTEIDNWKIDELKHFFKLREKLKNILIKDYQKMPKKYLITITQNYIKPGKKLRKLFRFLLSGWVRKAFYREYERHRYLKNAYKNSDLDKKVSQFTTQMMNKFLEKLTKEKLNELSTESNSKKILKGELYSDFVKDLKEEFNYQKKSWANNNNKNNI